MLASLPLALCLLGVDPGAVNADDLKAYEAARETVGRSAEAHIRLALWCESKGLTTERLRHLALAVLNEPRNATARGLLGLVDYQGKWELPDRVSEQVKADETLTAKLADYNARRARAANTADGQWKLALWCEEQGLNAEAKAHLATVVRLEPGREAAWKRLGYKKHGNRWATDQQIAQEKARSEARQKADKLYRPLLAKYRDALRDRDESKRAAASAALEKIDDPQAAPAVIAVFANGDDDQQRTAVEMLGRIDAPEATKGLAMMALFGRSGESRRAAAETLQRRDARDFVDLLLGFLRDPLKYEVKPVEGPGSPGILFVEGEKFNVRRVYDPDPRGIARTTIPRRLYADNVPFNPFSDENLAVASQGPVNIALNTGMAPGAQPMQMPVMGADTMAARRDLQIAQQLINIQSISNYSQQQLAADVAQVEAINAETRAVNEKTRPILAAVSGQDLGEKTAEWKAWWTDQKGYAFRTPTEPASKPTFTQFVTNPYAPVQSHNSCFGAGTPVRTLSGTVPIEEVRSGDQVLTQNPTTGKLGYTPVIAAYHNPPASTLKVAIGGDEIVATGIHRFWKAGHGWVMARELKPGDLVRVIGGTARVEKVDKHLTQPVFNLEVAEGQSFFVGSGGVLVHDNSLVEPVSAPFDSPAEPATLAQANR